MPYKKSNSKRELKKLRKIKKDIAEIQSIACIGYYELDISENEIFWSDEIYKIFGQNDQTYKIRKIQEFVHPDDIDYYKRAILTFMKNKKPYNFSYRIVRTDGNVRYIQEKGKFDFNDDNRPVRMFATIQDITEFKEAEEEYCQQALKTIKRETLKKAELEFLEILNGSSFGAWIIDFQNETLEYSTQWLKLIGAENISIKDRLVYVESIIHPEDQLKVANRKKDVIENLKSDFVVEYRIETVEKGYIWAFSQGRMIFDERGIPIKIYGISIDITDRKTAEEELQKNEYLFRTIIESINEPIFLKDRQGKIVVANSATGKAVEKNVSEILGNTDIEFYTDDKYAQIVQENDKRIMDMNKPEIIEELVPTSNGLRTYLTNKVPWHDVNGNVIGIIGTGRDITDKKRMEQELIRQANELNDKNKLITDFFINISHEFKTPISIMLLAIEMIEYYLKQTDLDHQRLEKNKNVIKQNAYRLGRLVENLLDITKIDAGFMKLNWVEADIVYLIRNLVKSMTTYTMKKCLNIRFYSNLKTKIIATDVQFIERIILNLVSNSIKHTPKGGFIKIKLNGCEDKIIISVRDNGEGIPSDKKDIIFDRFRQANTSFARSSEGCGIGLSLTKSLVEMLGGKITFESMLGIGSEFFVELPIIHIGEIQELAENNGIIPNSRIQFEFSDIYF